MRSEELARSVGEPGSVSATFAFCWKGRTPRDEADNRSGSRAAPATEKYSTAKAVGGDFYYFSPFPWGSPTATILNR